MAYEQDKKKGKDLYLLKRGGGMGEKMSALRDLSLEAAG